MKLSTDSATGVLQVSGTLDIDAANSLREALVDCFLHQAEVTIDLSEVTACDAAALQVLLAGRRDAVTAGKPFHLHAAAQAVTETATALGFSLNESHNGTQRNHPNAG
jgi:anti-anti-sigma factor